MAWTWCCVFIIFSTICFKLGASDTLPIQQAQQENQLLLGDAPASKEAYVTLLYGGFLLGARVLGLSLRSTGTEKDLVVLCTANVSSTTKEILKADGWKIKPVENIKNPYEGLSSRGNYFSGVFSKLHVWNLTEYDRIVYLDSDVLVLSNIDHLFDCGKFCAVPRHSDLFNSGVIVVEPSKEVFNDMLKKVPILDSYTNGDQGFLNVYFNDLVYMPMFNWSNPYRQHQHMRMPSGMNADIGQYYINSRWLIPDEQLKIIHFTLGPTKPWIWWTHILFDQSWHWNDVRKRLPQYPGYNDGAQPVFQPIFWLPYPTIIAMLVLMKFLRCPQVIQKNQITKLIAFTNDMLSYFYPCFILLVSYRVAFGMVPRTSMPNQGFYLFWLWSNFFIILIMSLFCFIFQKQQQEQKQLQQKTNFGQKAKTLLAYLIYNTSYFVWTATPFFVGVFSSRVMFFLLLLFVHLATSYVAGLCVIRMWTVSKKNRNSSRFF